MVKGKVFNSKTTYKFPNVIHATSSVENIRNVKITFCEAF